MRPLNYKFLGKTDRMRVPYSRHLTIIFNELERVAQLGYDPEEYLEEFVDRLQQVE
jgi:hypothetical protein